MTPTHLAPGYRRALLLAAALNLAMFFIEDGVGLRIGSAALLADAVDFIEDAFIYGVAVVAIGWSSKARGGAGLLQGLAMAAVGVVAARQVILRFFEGGAPLSGAVAAMAGSRFWSMSSVRPSWCGTAMATLPCGRSGSPPATTRS